MGPQLTALDLYCSAMLGIVSPLPPEQCAMSDMMRGMYASTHPEVKAAADPALLAHRDLVYEKHMGLPVDL